MTAAEWEPGVPIMPDNGCGSMQTVFMTPDERAAALAADTDPAPPWWRPGPGVGVDTSYYTRACKPCSVQWRGEEPCWVCGEESA